jgi:tryptophan synthase beta chain
MGLFLALAATFFGLEVTVYMVRVSCEQKPYRKSLMEVWGANVIPSPSTVTQVGRKILEQTPDTPGSLGIAISEAVEDAASHADTNYALGSVLNHVCLHQSIIGLEAMEQLRLVGDYPDVVFGACGGGSNFAGIAFPFVRDKVNGKDVRLVGVEPASCPDA